MKPRRISPVMIIAILAMSVAWLALRFVGNGGSPSMSPASSLFIGIARMLLAAGIIICLIATALSWFLKPKQEPAAKRTAGAGALAAIMIALVSALVAGTGVWDAAYGRGGSGEWSGLGELFVYAIAIPGGIAALLMAALVKSMHRFLRVPCTVLALLALGLPFAMSPLRKARDKKRYEEIMRSGKTRKLSEEAKHAEAGGR